MSSGSVAKAYCQIIPTTKGIKNSLTKELSGVSKNAGADSGNSFASSFKNMIKVAAIGETLRQTLMAGANIEQSMGGIETLFKNSSDTIKQYAINAYDTAGISANRYMEQATTFSASLLQSLNGDTAAAAETTNMAIIDMSDNANKMGTSLEMIQNAYQGFAKQNYTMLDNLKIGYGGTKTEMERLLADAQKLTGIKYDINNLSDVYNAIHVIQNELGITGTTAKEAEKTLSGSFNSMKSAAENFLASITGVKDGSGQAILDVKDSLNALIDSASTFMFGNLVPVLNSMIVNIPMAVVTLIDTSAPLIIESMGTLFSNIIDFLYSESPKMIEAGGEMLTQFLVGIIENLPSLIENGGQMIVSLQQGLISNLPVILQTAWDLIIQFGMALLQNAPAILQSGIELIGQLLVGLVNGIPDIITTAFNIALQIGQTFINTDWLSIGANIINGIASGILNAVSGLIGSAIQACKSLTDSVKSFFGISSPSKLFKNEIGKFIPQGLAIGITANIDSVYDAMAQLDQATYGAITNRGFDMNLNSNIKPYESLNDKLERLIGVSQPNIEVYVDAKTEVDGKQIARTTAPYTRKEIKRIDNFNKRLNGEW